MRLARQVRGVRGVGVAVAAIGTATALRAASPAQSVVLDLGAGAIAVLCAAMTAGRTDTPAVLAATTAVIASGLAWLRTGRRRALALAAAACAVLVAIVALRDQLAQALLAPGRVIARAWQGVSGARRRRRGAWSGARRRHPGHMPGGRCHRGRRRRGSRRASLDAVAIALPVVAAPAGVLASRLSYWLTVAALLALTLVLTAWAALGPSLAPAGAALVSAALTVAWALAAPLPT